MADWVYFLFDQAEHLQDHKTSFPDVAPLAGVASSWA